MFKEWGFLLGEIWVLLALAALIGLIAGWLIWGGRKSGDTNLQADLDRANARAKKAEDELAALRSAKPAGNVDGEAATTLRTQLDACRDARSEDQARIEALEAELGAARAQSNGNLGMAAVAAPVMEAVTPAIETPEIEAPSLPDAPVETGTRPAALEAARNGQPDDLKLINGVGPKLERLCNSLGFFHFDQIAAWTADEVAWVDENLEGFKGRVTRDEWVDQAKVLAAGGAPRS